ncbi:hypothetical protein Tco_0496432 [Tanacetum coccineum]
MIRGQPGLDELDFDDLYNNLKVYEHELKGVYIQTLITFIFVNRSQGVILKQKYLLNSTYQDILKLSRARCQLLPTVLLTQMKSYVPSLLNKASMPTTHDDGRSDKEVYEEDRKIHLTQTKNGFAKVIKEIRANGRQKRRLWLLKIQTQKPWWKQTTMKDIDWTRILDAVQWSLCMMALMELKQDVWSMEFDAELVLFGTRWTVDFAGAIMMMIHQISMCLESLDVRLKTQVKNGSMLGGKYWMDLKQYFQNVKKSAMINPKQTWSKREKLSRILVNRGHPEEDLRTLTIIDSGCSGKYDRRQGTSCLILKSSRVAYVAFGNDSKVEEFRKRNHKKHA